MTMFQKKNDLADPVLSSQVHSEVCVPLSAGLPGSLLAKSAQCQTEDEEDDKDAYDDECVRAKSTTGWRVMSGPKMRARSVRHPHFKVHLRFFKKSLGLVQASHFF